MISRRIAAALVVLGTLGAAVAIAASMNGTSVRNDPAALQPLVTTTSEPDFAALVESGAYHTLSEEEAALTDEAITRSTSTTTTTTVTTTTTQAPSTTAAQRTTPTTDAQPPAPAPTSSNAGLRSGAESDFASSINAFRGSNGLPSLTRDGSLDSYARAWSQQMAEQGGISHSDIGSLLPPWSAVGENVGQGGSVGGIFDALVASDGHRANMLDDFTHMGIGVWQDSQGVYWTTHVFTR